MEKHSDKWESYFGVYDEYIPPSLHNILSSGRKKITFVEVGVQRGGSLEMWSKFFADEQVAYRDILQEFFEIEIIGIDIDPECLKLKYNSSNVKVIIGDQGKPEFWDSFLKEHPQIDIFIDDGGHFMDQQVLTFEKIFPALSIGGVYFCEDCHTSYMPYNGGGTFRAPGATFSWRGFRVIAAGSAGGEAGFTAGPQPTISVSQATPPARPRSNAIDTDNSASVQHRPIWAHTVDPAQAGCL